MTLLESEVEGSFPCGKFSTWEISHNLWEISHNLWEISHKKVPGGTYQLPPGTFFEVNSPQTQGIIPSQGNSSTWNPPPIVGNFPQRIIVGNFPQWILPLIEIVKLVQSLQFVPHSASHHASALNGRQRQKLCLSK